MKKQGKIISIILIAAVLILFTSTMNFAAYSSEDATSDIDSSSKTTTKSIIDTMGTDSNISTTQIQNFGQNVVTIIRVVGTMAAVIIILVIGIKYMMGSAEDRAEYKKTMIPYLIGAALLFAATTIVTFVIETAGSFGVSGG